MRDCKPTMMENRYNIKKYAAVVETMFKKYRSIENV
jgi:hypothetical protein